MPALLTTASSLMCPHGGTVTATPGGPPMATADATILRATDTFIIAGCPFVTPAAVPDPCTTVQWVSTAQKVKHAGDLVLTEASVGLCIGAAPQGAVIVAATQPKVSGL
jgi:hypothetical protein